MERARLPATVHVAGGPRAAGDDGQRGTSEARWVCLRGDFGQGGQPVLALELTSAVDADDSTDPRP
jgi:hypothetical protein